MACHFLMAVMDGSWFRGKIGAGALGVFFDPRYDEALDIAWIDTYVNDDIGKLPVQRRCAPEEARRLAPSCLLGSGAAAIVLAKRLRGESVPW